MTETRVSLPITVLVQTKNEENGIRACLSKLGAFDEVVVVDSCSTDRTVEIAQSLGVRVELFRWNGQYPKKKEWQLRNLETKYSWVLFLDADEAPSAELVSELAHIFKNAKLTRNKIAAFDVRLWYWFEGRQLRHGHTVIKRCLVYRDQTFFPIVDDLEAPGMGELEGHYQPQVAGGVRKLRGRLEHRDMDPINSWFDRHNRYSDWEAYLRRNGGVSGEVDGSRSKQGRLFAAVPFKPAVFFLYCYLFRAGFLDGRAGFDYALALAMYYWQIGLKTRERKLADDEG